MIATPSDETIDTAKTYDDPGRDGQNALPPDSRTDPDLAAVLQAWPELRPVV